MKTLLLTPAEQDIALAGKILREGGLVGMPTETVYGLAANALDGAAVASIFAAKGRPQDNPLIVHISRLEQLEPLVSEIPETAVQLAAEYWPGPLTMVLPKSGIIPDEVSCGLDTVAVRMPSHPVARALIDASGVPLAAPSANLSGRPSTTTAAHVMHDMEGRIAAVVDGGECTYGVESTVVSLCGEKPALLRPGAVTPAMLEAVVGEITIDNAVLHVLEDDRKAASPGMKYKHYAPDTEVTIVRGSLEKFAQWCEKHAAEGTYALCFEGESGALSVPAIEYGRADDLLSQAHGLFAALRELDERGAKVAYVRPCEPEGMGLAVYNRLLRAAAFRVEEA